MSSIVVGSKVKCVKTDNIEGLELNKVYTVAKIKEGDWGTFIVLEEVKGEYLIERFEDAFVSGDTVICVDNSDFEDELHQGQLYTLDKVYSNNYVTLKEADKTIYKIERFEHYDLSIAKPETEELEDTQRYEMADGTQLFDKIETMFSPEEVKGFYKINALKYLTRFEHKAGVVDIDKSIIYMKRLKQFVEGQNET